MAEFALLTPTAVALNAAVPYTSTIVKGGCNIRHRSGSSVVTIRGGSCCSPAVYRVTFNANVTGVAGEIQLALSQDGEIVQGSTMSVVPSASADVWSIGTTNEIVSDCDCSKISAKVIEGATVTINSANLIVERVS